MLERIQALAFVSIFAAGCSPALHLTWSPVEAFQEELPKSMSDADAVYLLVQQRILLVSRWQSPSYTHWQEHRALKILTEKGYEHADVRVRYRKKGKFISFRARTIAPDGTVQEVEPERVYDDDEVDLDEEDDDIKVRVFTFPNVKVGSVLEYSYTLEVPWVYTQISRYVNAKLPTKRYEVEILGTKDIRYSLKGYNTKVEWDVGSEGKMWRVAWVTDNLEASHDESFDGNRNYFDAWWNFRIKQFVKYNVVSDLYKDWNTSYRGRADKLYFDHKEHYKDFDPKVDDSSCKDVKCRVAKRLAFLKDKAPFSGWSTSWAGRKAATVIESREANQHEKARLLYKMLDDAKIQSHFAYCARAIVNHVDWGFPYSSGLPHVLLYLPAQDGLTEPLWIDPACEYCEVGQLPPWSADSDAFLVKATKGPLDKRPKMAGEKVKTQGTLAPVGTEVEAITVRVDESGNAEIDLVRHWKGRNAQVIRRITRKWDKEKWKKDSKARVEERIKTATLEDFATEITCDEGLTSCSHKLTMSAKGYATRDGEDLYVPLTALDAEWENSFKTKDRQTAIRMPYAYGDDDTLTIVGPSGFSGVKLPKASKSTTKIIEAEISTSAENSNVVVSRKLRAHRGVHAKIHQEEARKVVEAFAGVRKTVIQLTAAKAE